MSGHRFETYLKERVRAALESVSPQEAADVYVVSLFVYDEDDDPQYPTVTVGVNTEAQVGLRPIRPPTLQNRTPSGPRPMNRRHAGTMRSGPSRPWRSSLTVRLIPGAPSSEAHGFRRRGYRSTSTGMTSPRRGRGPGEPLHKDVCRPDGRNRAVPSPVRRGGDGFGRPIPLVIHELEYYDEIAEQNVRANGRSSLQLASWSGFRVPARSPGRARRPYRAADLRSLSCALRALRAADLRSFILCPSGTQSCRSAIVILCPSALRAADLRSLSCALRALRAADLRSLSCALRALRAAVPWCSTRACGSRQNRRCLALRPGQVQARVRGSGPRWMTVRW